MNSSNNLVLLMDKGLLKRWKSLIKQIGGNKKAAEITGNGLSTIPNWNSGQTKIPLQAAILVCSEAGKSLDWLAYGKNTGQFDDSIILDCMQAVDQWIIENDLPQPEPEDKREIVEALAEMVQQESGEKEENIINIDKYKRIVLASSQSLLRSS